MAQGPKPTQYRAWKGPSIEWALPKKSEPPFFYKNSFGAVIEMDKISDQHKLVFHTDGGIKKI